jgi:hypothetical protein
VTEPQDLSGDYMKAFISVDVGPLNDATELEDVLSAPLHGDIFVRKGVFPIVAGMSLVTTRRMDSDMDKIYTTLRTGYEHAWNQGSETDVAMVAYALTAKVWSDLGPLADLSLEINQNIVDRSGATSENLRPDLCVWMDGALLFKGEMKCSDSDFEQAKAELTSKMNGWSAMSLRGLPFLPCFAVAGKWMQFFAICPPSCNDALPITSAVSTRLNMTNHIHRMSIMRISCNMMRVFPHLRKRMPTTVPQLYARRKRRTGYIQIMGNYVVKVCIPAPDTIYDTLAKAPCTIKVMSRVVLSNGLSKLRIEPLCAEVLPADLIEVKSCVRNLLMALAMLHQDGVIHRDIRWPNILKGPDGSWVLADFELANEASAAFPTNSINPKYLPPEVISGGGYLAMGDMYRVGMLIPEWAKARKILLPTDVQAWSDRLTTVDPAARPTAMALLSELGTWFAC